MAYGFYKILHARFKTISHSMHEVYGELFGKQHIRYGRYIAVAGGAVAVLCLGGAVFFGYRWYIISREQTAQQGLMATFAEYARVTKSGKTEEWEYAQTMFKLEHDQHTHSYLSPYFLVVRADAFFNQGKYDQALATMQEAVAQLPKSGTLTSLYALKYALMQIDTEQSHDQGLQSLIALAHDQHNQHRDVALFYLGSYYKMHDDRDQARSAWQELVDQWQNPSAFAVSPWVQQAQEQLKKLM